MNLLQTSTIASGRRMQWVCGAEVVDEALAVASRAGALVRHRRRSLAHRRLGGHGAGRHRL
jgi:hypothetical protein